jgi:RNA polymerase sigma factor (sigma-70 family)
MSQLQTHAPPIPQEESISDSRTILDEAVRDQTNLASLRARARIALRNRWGIDPEEIVQQTILRVLEKAHEYDPSKGHPLPWLQKFMGYILLEESRKQRKFPSTGRDLTFRYEAVSDFETTEEKLDEMRTRREKYLPLLSPQTRDALRLRSEGLKDAEIAKRLKTNRVNVRKIVSRGCETIQRLAADANKGGLK